MRWPTQPFTRSPTVQQPSCDDGCFRSAGGGRTGLPRRFSAKEKYLSGRRRTSARGKRTADYTITVIATNLISGTVTVRAPSKAEALAEVEQRINLKLRQE